MAMRIETRRRLFGSSAQISKQLRSGGAFNSFRKSIERGEDMLRHWSWGNELLTGLPSGEMALIGPLLRRVRLVPGQTLLEQGHAIEHVYFVEEGLVSLTAGTHLSYPCAQVAMVGREGLVGSDGLLGVDCTTIAAAVVQIPGGAMRIASHDLRCLQDECPELRRRCFCAISALFEQVMETSAYNACSSLAERCVRWLLIAHERLKCDEIHITHGAISAALGVRRSGISAVLAGLEEAQLISLQRGRVIIHDRARLEEVLIDFKGNQSRFSRARKIITNQIGDARHSQL
jgi:CRP-like cAMP-binding protein